MVLDSGPLGEICNPGIRLEAKEWVNFIKERKILLQVAEIIDYELRRNFILEKLEKSKNNLNKYRQTNRIIPITSEIMLTAAELWAEIRSSGISTASKENIDCDVILVAQAISLSTEFKEIIIVTTNPKHIYRFKHLGIKVWDWKQALNDCKYKEINFYNPETKIS